MVTTSHSSRPLGSHRSLVATAYAKTTAPATAYRAPALASLGAVQDFSVALDYVSTSTSESDQPFLSKFRLGAQAKLAGIVALRAGVSQGYPTLGAGVHTRFFRLDYVLYGVEDGRTLGQVTAHGVLSRLAAQPGQTRQDDDPPPPRARQ